MIEKRMLEALNVQINEEMNSAYIYFAMAADMDDKNWSGAASWLKAQAQEEVNHAMKIYSYINSRGGKAVLKAIKEPKADYASYLEIFEGAYKHEVYITSCINKLVALAKELDDNASQVFLSWFVSEQVEEEESAESIVFDLKRIKENTNGLYMLDNHLRKRQG